METGDWTAFDAIVLLVIGLSFLVAMVRGFATIALTLAAWVGAVAVTLYAFTPASNLTRDLISPPELADLITVPVLFIVSVIVLRLLASFIGDKVRSSSVGFLDRSLGGLLGLIVGALLVSAAYLLLDSTIDTDDQPDWIREAQLRPLVAYGAEMVAVLGPELANRGGDSKPAKRALDKMRETLPQFERSARDVAEKGYNDLERRVLEEAVRRGLSRDCDPELDEDCPDG